VGVEEIKKDMDKTEFVALIEDYGKGADIDIDAVIARAPIGDNFWYFYDHDSLHLPERTLIYLAYPYRLIIRHLELVNPPATDNIFFVEGSASAAELPDEILMGAVEDLPFLEEDSDNFVLSWIMKTFDVDEKTAKSYLLVGVGIFALLVIISMMMRK